MRVAETRNYLVFWLDDLNRADTLITNAHSVTSYPLSDLASQATLDLKQQATHHETTYHLVESIKRAIRYYVDLEVIVKWLGFDYSHNEACNPDDTLKKDILVVLKHFLQSLDDRNLKSQTTYLYIKSRNLLRKIISHTPFLAHCSKSLLSPNIFLCAKILWLLCVVIFCVSILVTEHSNCILSEYAHMVNAMSYSAL